MKKVIFTTILLLILGTAWTLYLEQSNKRFIKKLPKPRATSATRHVKIPEAPVVSENSDSPSTDFTRSDDSIRHARAENSHKYLHPHEKSLEPSEDVGFTFDESLTEYEKPQESSQASTKLSQAEYEKRQLARETAQKILANPNIWVKGTPGEVGSMFVLTDAESAIFFQANYTSHPTEKTRSALASFEKLSKTTSYETHTIVVEDSDLNNLKSAETLNYKGQTFYILGD